MPAASHPKPLNHALASREQLACRVHQLAIAWNRGDEVMVRLNLREVAGLAMMLARSDPLPMGGLAARVRIAAESGDGGAGDWGRQRPGGRVG